MFKKPGVRVGGLRDMGNASERMDGSERYDDGGGPEGPLGMRWRGSNKLFTRGVRRRRSQREGHEGHGRGDGHTEPYRPVRVAGRVGDGAPRCWRSVCDARTRRARRAAQGPAGTALTVADSPARWPSEASSPGAESPARSRRENRSAPPQ